MADRRRAPRLDDLSPRERSRTWRLRFTVREWLSRSFVLVPSLYIAAALALPAILLGCGGGTSAQAPPLPLCGALGATATGTIQSPQAVELSGLAARRTLIATSTPPAAGTA